MKIKGIKLSVSFCALFIIATPLFSQDLEPRRWTVMPEGMNVIGIGYGHTSGDVLFDPVMQIEDAEVKADTLAVSYIRSFSLAGKALRFDAFVPWHSGEWKGTLRGNLDSTERQGLGDSRFRLSVNLLDTQNLNETSKTVVGAGIAVTVPTGEYDKNKLINLGQNRFTIRPQMGVVHTRGAWSYEVTGSVFFFTDNDDYFKNRVQEQDPLYAIQSHVVYTFSPGMWTSLSAGYGWGGNTSIDKVSKDNEWDNFMTALSFGFPLSRTQSVKLNYLHAQTQNVTGSNTNTLSMGWSVRF